VACIAQAGLYCSDKLGVMTGDMAKRVRKIALATLVRELWLIRDV
jgi:hypothetical protein